MINKAARIKIEPTVMGDRIIACESQQPKFYLLGRRATVVIQARKSVSRQRVTVVHDSRDMKAAI